MTIKKKKEPKLLLFDLWLPQTCPRGKIICTTVFYSSLPLIWYATWLCLYKMDFGPFGATYLWPCPQGYIKIPNMFLQSSSIELLPVKVSRFLHKWSRSNGVTLQTDVRMDRQTDGWRASQYPCFFFKKRVDKNGSKSTKSIHFPWTCYFVNSAACGSIGKLLYVMGNKRRFYSFFISLFHHSSFYFCIKVYVVGTH